MSRRDTFQQFFASNFAILQAKGHKIAHKNLLFYSLFSSNMAIVARVQSAKFQKTASFLVRTSTAGLVEIFTISILRPTISKISTKHVPHLNTFSQQQVFINFPYCKMVQVLKNLKKSVTP